MTVTMLRTKLHRAAVTEADLNYEGSISIAPELIEASGLLLHERVEIYNVNNGQRFATYVIPGKTGQICLNGAAARLAHPGDRVIIAAYCQMDMDAAAAFKPKVVLLDEQNRIQ
ncbi:aspartate 1-decarboxylase [Spirochaeta dissipatitropha]